MNLSLGMIIGQVKFGFEFNFKLWDDSGLGMIIDRVISGSGTFLD